MIIKLPVPKGGFNNVQSFVIRPNFSLVIIKFPKSIYAVYLVNSIPSVGYNFYGVVLSVSYLVDGFFEVGFYYCYGLFPEQVPI